MRWGRAQTAGEGKAAPFSWAHAVGGKKASNNDAALCAALAQPWVLGGRVETERNTMDYTCR